MRKLHSFDQSPFYKTRSHKRLAGYLLVTEEQLRCLANEHQPYKIFPEKKSGRTIENPKDALKKVHRRINDLLARIEYPDYLYSAVKGRSYVRNAEHHIKAETMLKTDISQFFQSVSKDSVFQLFRRDFRCEPDIAKTLSRILTCNGHLPTGGPASPILSFFCNRNLFDGLAALADRAGMTMSVYVDDVTLSGKVGSRNLLSKVKKVIADHGYASHKDKRYREGSMKVVTGVGISNRSLTIPEKRKGQLYSSLKKLRKTQDPLDRVLLYPSVIGRLNEAVRLDPSHETLLRTLRKEQKKVIANKYGITKELRSRGKSFREIGSALGMAEADVKELAREETYGSKTSGPAHTS